MSDFYTFLFLMALVAFVGMLIAGATDKVVIYYDNQDFITSFMSFGSLAIGFLIAAFFEAEWIKNTVIAFASLSAIYFLYNTFLLSIKYNKSLKIGVFVGIFKILASLFGTLVIASQISRIFDEKSTLKDQVIAVAIIGFLGWIGRLLINGERVYSAKGWTVE